MDLLEGEVVWRGRPSWRAGSCSWVGGGGGCRATALVRDVVTTRRLEIRVGILSRRERTTLLDQVQNTDTARSLLDRILDVGTVDLDTAGAGGG